MAPVAAWPDRTDAPALALRRPGTPGVPVLTSLPCWTT